jgi:hypothetical protein
MRRIIESVLRRHKDRQINLASKAARKAIAEEIALVLAERGTYTEYGDDEIEKEKAREAWVCSICGKNTFEVEYDYIGSGTNHLGCELQAEADNAAGMNPNDPTYEPPKYPIPEYDLQTGQKNPLYGELIQEMDQKITQMEEAIQPWQKERSKLSDQLIDGSDGEPRYIYESPDGGKTIYRRPIGNYDPVVKELVKSPDRDISFKPEF